MIRPLTLLSPVALPNGRNLAVLELEAGSIVWMIRRLRPYVFGISFVLVSDDRDLKFLGKIGEYYP